MIKHRIAPAIACLVFLGTLAGVSLLTQDSTEYYILDGKIVAISSAVSEKSVSHATERFRYLYDTYLQPNNIGAHIAIVPDKSYYLPDPKGRGQMDYETLFTNVYTQMDYAAPVDLTDTLDGGSYYITDSHWRQECLASTAASVYEQISGNTGTPAENYDTVTAADNFTGSYRDAADTAGLLKQKAFSDLGTDTIAYLTSETLSQAVVYNYDSKQTTGLYDFEQLESSNPYDFFLSGPTSVLAIENPSADTGQKLIVFRDSYGSSLIPLLVPYYEEILVIDIRYTMSAKLGEFLDFTEFEGADALYLYSTSILNKSVTLR